MQPNHTKRIVVVAIIAVLSISAYILLNSRKVTLISPLVEEVKTVWPIHSVIGKSVRGRDIDAYTYGDGPTHIMFVGGIHGGYEWNSVVLAYTFMDYVTANLQILGGDRASMATSSHSLFTITVIPSANPDGVFEVTGKEGRFTSADVSTSSKVLVKGRFDANSVDLNRNFDCKWQSESTWQSKTVSAGTAAFSEPETAALRDYIASFHPTAAIFWHSQSNAVYASRCGRGILPVTTDMMNVYSKAAGYPAVKTFDAYATTGAADDWLASIGIPAITVELSSHSAIEWDRNLAGVKAVLKYFEKEYLM